ncbi:MAG: hypothetical protein JWL62_3842, partial [Hyphomicrobiales bacterium]|nr:hypothetical protein [Hyphomicrobiales bacterium]
MSQLFLNSRRWNAGLRPRLYCLALLAILPLGVFRIIERSAEADQALASANEQLSGLADRGVNAAMDVMEDARGALEILSHVPAVQTYSNPECHDLLDNIVKSRGWATVMTVLDRSGIARCSTGAEVLGVDFADRPYVQEAILNRKFTVSDLLTGRLTHRATMAASMPVIVAGNLRSMLVVTLDLEEFDQALSQIEKTVPGGVAYLKY